MTARAVLAALAAVALLAALPTAAAAVEATAAEVRELARQAPDDAAALARLRSVDRVDGRPVDLARALDDAEGAELRARLRALSAASGTRSDAARERREAEAVLDQRRFRGSSLPQPLRSPLERLGDVLDDVYYWLVERIPGGRWTVWTLVALAVIALALLLTTRIVRRRVGEEEAEATAARRTGEDPRALEREADAAERAGDAARAIRLRFRAGLLDLDARGVIELRPGLTTGAVARELRSPTFDALAATFDAVAYGGVRPPLSEAAAAKAGWERLRAEAGRRRRPARLERAA